MLTILDPLFKSRNISEITKTRIFEAFVSSIFLYNSELWTVTPTVEKGIDSFQRRLLRKVIQISWPKIITNKQLYEKTKAKPWSQTIRRRRLTWVGHLMRLNEETPARRALDEYLKVSKRPVGHPKLTWWSLVLSDIKKYNNLNVNVESEVLLFRDLVKLCADRKAWRQAVKHIMLQCATGMY